MITIDKSETDVAAIRVVGVGGCGCNAVNNMIDKGLNGVKFIAVNTDLQVLNTSLAQHKIQIGKELTRGLGAGGKPEVGRAAAEENIEEIKEALKGSNMIFVTAGMGGGTGTGAAPVIAKIGLDMDALVVGIVTKPYRWEGKRIKLAEDGLNELKQFVDAFIVINNDRILELYKNKVKFREAARKADEVLFNATKGISDIITQPGYINVDFADVKAVMKGMGDAIMGTGIAVGENRAAEAIENALNSPMLDGVDINGAQGVLVNITSSEDSFETSELDSILSIINEKTGNNVNLYHGLVLLEEPMDELIVTVVATGYNNTFKQATPPTQTYIKSKDVQLTFNDVPGTNPYFNRGPVKVKTNSHPTNNVQKETIYNPYNTYANSSRPKGENELKKYDVPAILRRNGGNKYDINVNGEAAIATEAHVTTEYNDIDRNKLDTPTFIRKMTE